MSLGEIVIEGTLGSDGTLRLDEKPDLLPGRVTVVLRQAVQAVPTPQENWFECLQRIRADREKSGYPFLNDGEINAYIESLREGDLIDDILREGNEQQPRSEPV